MPFCHGCHNWGRLFQPFFVFPLHFPALILFRNISPFVIELLTTGKPDLYLYQAAFKINLKGNQGNAFFP